MQGTNRAPILIRMYVEGPIMGLKDGLIMMGEPVIIAKRCQGSHIEEDSLYSQFLMISAMNTETWTRVRV